MLGNGTAQLACEEVSSDVHTGPAPSEGSLAHSSRSLLLARGIIRLYIPRSINRTTTLCPLARLTWGRATARQNPGLWKRKC